MYTNFINPALSSLKSFSFGNEILRRPKIQKLYLKIKNDLTGGLGVLI